MSKRYTTKKAFTWLLKWTLWFEKRQLPTLPHCPIEHGVPSVHGRYGGGDIPYCTKWINEKAFTWLLKWTLCLLKNRLPLFHIAPLNTVYHQCMDSMTVAISHIAQNEQLKKRSLDCSNERFGLKKAATYSPALHCSTIGASGLNFSVRNGKRWNPTAITTS